MKARSAEELAPALVRLPPTLEILWQLHAKDILFATPSFGGRNNQRSQKLGWGLGLDLCFPSIAHVLFFKTEDDVWQISTKVQFIEPVHYIGPAIVKGISTLALSLPFNTPCRKCEESWERCTGLVGAFLLTTGRLGYLAEISGYPAALA